jgi:hypothetical protein
MACPPIAEASIAGCVESSFPFHRETTPLTGGIERNRLESKDFRGILTVTGAAHECLQRRCFDASRHRMGIAVDYRVCIDPKFAHWPLGHNSYSNSRIFHHAVWHRAIRLRYKPAC